MNTQLKNIVVVISVLFIIACNKEKNNNVVFEKQLNIKEDATTLWLRNNENYNNSKTYFTVFYKYRKRPVSFRVFTEKTSINNFGEKDFSYFVNNDTSLTEVDLK